MFVRSRHESIKKHSSSIAYFLTGIKQTGEIIGISDFNQIEFLKHLSSHYYITLLIFVICICLLAYAKYNGGTK